jgi:hypothetical protein
MISTILIPFGCVLAQMNPSQRKPAPPAAFEVGDFLVGPSILLGNLEGGGLGLGVEGEYGFAKNMNPGGTVGLSFRAHTYSASSSGFGYRSSLRITPIAAGVNFHLPLTDTRIDPYAGLALGYARASFSDNAGSDFTVDSGIYLMLDGGLRFRINPRIALQGALSAGTRGDVGLLRLAGLFKL